MLIIKDYDHNNNYRKLNNDEKVFHNALNYVLRGEKRFHIEENNCPCFDLVYEDTDSKVKTDPTFPDSDFFFSEIIFPPYLMYDENDIVKINLELLDGFDEIFFEDVNEYSVVIASLAIKHKGMKATFQEEKINRFSWIKDKVSVRHKPETDNYIYVQRDYYPIYTTKDRFCAAGLFHSMFILQWATDLPKEKIKYLSFSIRKTEGIGSIMSCFSKVSSAFKKHGIKVFIDPGCTRFDSDMLARYFVFSQVPEDADESNTAYVNPFNTFVLNYFVQKEDPNIGLDMLQPEFVKQMDEYTTQVIGDKKVLGVLLRGTDIIIANYVGSYRPVEIEDALKMIKERVDKYNYDKIFVATEDMYFLERMVASFPHKVLAVSQERHNISDFKNVKYISDLEKQKHTNNEYLASVEDTTVNYLYAMYMLSRCESFIANCMCSGVDIVTSFNKDKFDKLEIMSEMI